MDLQRRPRCRDTFARRLRACAGEIFSRRAHGEAQAAGFESAQTGEAVLDGNEFPENFLARGAKLAAGIRQVRALANLLEQRQADGLGEFLDLHRHRGL